MYIGQSTDIKKRWTQHLIDLNGGYHHNCYLQRAWNKYGESNFEFIVLEQCTKDKIASREAYWIKLKESLCDINGYNLTTGGEHYNVSDKTREKLSIAAKNKPKEKHSWYGRHHSEQSKRKISEANSGANHHAYGKHPSEQTLQKMRGRIPWNKGKKSNIDQRGENNPSVKIKEQDAIVIIRMLSNGRRICDISEELRVSYSIVKNIKQKKTWLHLTKDITFPTKVA